jgi:UDP-N-acetylmuramoyl-L-alanyl-D-glutamate--2,6-diaminopimelate ligase
MEVSSHAIALHRVDGMRFRVAVFTNLSRDHLDFHGSMEEYFAVKAELFEPTRCDLAVVNLDSPYGRLLADLSAVPTEGFSLDEAEQLDLAVDGSSFTWRGHPVTLSIGGAFNVSNALAAAHTSSALGLDDATIAAGLSRPIVVEGRFENVDVGQPFAVIVDYAHTPDGLEQLLFAAGELVTDDGRVILVFGCGGDRDASKRPAMGRVAVRRADLVIVTADNSRRESTSSIIDAILDGIDRTVDRRSSEVVVEPDRRLAISKALGHARPGDIVLVAGKGHETTQILGDEVSPFDDRVVVAEEWRRLEVAS